jgi:uncharacterized iron-regulated membrane protein
LGDEHAKETEDLMDRPPETGRADQRADASAVPAGLNAAATAIICAAVVGGALWSDRALGRWWQKNHPLAAPKARIRRAQATYRERREIATDVALVVGALGLEIARAVAMDRARSARTGASASEASNA